MYWFVIHEEEQRGCDDVENDEASAGRRHFVVQWNSDGRNERYTSCFRIFSISVTLCDLKCIQIETADVLKSDKVSDNYLFKRVADYL